MRIRRGEKTQWELFFAKVDRDGPIPTHMPHLGKCHIWTGSRRQQGHGYFWYDNSIGCAHRFAWMASGGELYDGLQVLHQCDNGWCVNPAHLFLGTVQDNMNDKISKGRQSMGERVSKLTRGENNPSVKLTEADVVKMRDMRNQIPKPTLKEIASHFPGVCLGTVKNIVAHRSWRHVQ